MSDIDERLEEEILHAFRKSFDSQQAGINANFLMDIQREIERLRADLAAVTAEREKCAEEITEACELLHKLTAIIPGNDGAGEEVAKFLRDAAIRRST